MGTDIEKVCCHKFIVAMVSDVIQSESVMKDEIIITNIKKDILQEIIDYCYKQMIGPFVNKSHVSQNYLILVLTRYFRWKISVMGSRNFKSEFSNQLYRRLRPDWPTVWTTVAQQSPDGNLSQLILLLPRCWARRCLNLQCLGKFRKDLDGAFLLKHILVLAWRISRKMV